MRWHKEDSPIAYIVATCDDVTLRVQSCGTNRAFLWRSTDTTDSELLYRAFGKAAQKQCVDFAEGWAKHYAQRHLV